MEKRKEIMAALNCRFCNPHTWRTEYVPTWKAEIYECENCGHQWPGEPTKEDIKRVKEIVRDLNKNPDNHLR